MNLLNIENLSVELETDDGLLRAVDALRLSIERGETFALVGESGCGKSMTALALLRLLPENGWIAGGDIHLAAPPEAGQGAAIDLLALPERAMRGVRGGRVAMIFQEPSTSLNPVMRVGEQIIEAIEAHTPLRGAAARQRALQWLQRVGIPEPERRIDDYPFRMSGGQKQRVMIALALAAEPDLLVADEPTTALDVTIQAQVLDLLRELQAERRMGLLLITHDLAVVSGMAQRVALMYAGQIVETATARDFFAAPRHPYAQALLRALPGAGLRHRALEAIPGTVPALTQDFAGCRFAPRCEHALPHCAGELPPQRSLPGGREVRCWLEPEAMVQASTDARAAAVPAPAAVVPPAAPSAAPLLELRSLGVRFPIRSGLLQRVQGHFDAVRDVSFCIAAGETLALVGESGCGKTTTAKAIVQLLRGTAEVSGQALLDGRDLLALQGADLHAARRAVQIVFQDPFGSLNPRLRVDEILDEGLAALSPELDAGQRRARIAELVEQVGLRRDALARHPHEFSGGQRQRIAIARALAVRPRLVVCDEPTSALDVSVQAQILNLLRELQRELGVAYLFVTHNIAVVETIADRIAVMQRGRIVEQGCAESVLRHAQHPYTAQLLSAVPRVLAA